MKKFLVAFVALAALALSTTAFAQVKEFGPSFNRFTIDVPDGWTTQVQGDGATTIVSNADNALSIYIAKKDGTPIKEFLINMAKKGGIANPVVEKQDENTYSIEAKLNGAPILCMVTADDDSFVYFVLYGKDMETLLKIMSTCQDK